MKKILALSLLMLSGATSAVTENAAIPLALQVNKQCTISNVASEVIIPVDRSVASSVYTVTCNTPYTISTDSAKWNGGWNSYVSNIQGEQLKTGMATTAVSDNAHVPLHTSSSLSRAGYSVDDYLFEIAVTDLITPTTRAGVYTDTYYVTVNF